MLLLYCMYSGTETAFVVASPESPRTARVCQPASQPVETIDLASMDRVVCYDRQTALSCNAVLNRFRAAVFETSSTHDLPFGGTR